MKTQSQMIIGNAEKFDIDLFISKINKYRGDFTFMDFDHDADFNTIITFSDHQ